MDDPCPKYERFEKPMYQLGNQPSHYSLASATVSLEQLPVVPPPCSEKHSGHRRSYSLSKRESLLIAQSQEVVRPKLKNASCPACVLRYLRDILRAWVLSQRKPYSAITVQIDRLTSEDFEEGDIGGIPDLVEVIRIQDSGPTEAARAIRKKLYVSTSTFFMTSTYTALGNTVVHTDSFVR